MHAESPVAHSELPAAAFGGICLARSSRSRAVYRARPRSSGWNRRARPATRPDATSRPHDRRTGGIAVGAGQPDASAGGRDQIPRRRAVRRSDESGGPWMHCGASTPNSMGFPIRHLAQLPPEDTTHGEMLFGPSSDSVRKTAWLSRPQFKTAVGGGNRRGADPPRLPRTRAPTSRGGRLTLGSRVEGKRVCSPGDYRATIT